MHVKPHQIKNVVTSSNKTINQTIPKVIPAATIKKVIPASTIKETLDDPTKFVKVKHNGVSKFISTNHIQPIGKSSNGISIPIKFYDSKNPITVSKPVGSVLPNGRLFSVVPNSTGLNNRRTIPTSLNKNSLVSISSKSLVNSNFPIQKIHDNGEWLFICYKFIKI